jgi:hypothetical protein
VAAPVVAAAAAVVVLAGAAVVPDEAVDGAAVVGADVELAVLPPPELQAARPALRAMAPSTRDVRFGTP